MSTARAALTEYGHSSLYGRSLNARSFHRAATAALLGYVRKEDPAAIAGQVWASDQDAHVVARAATSPSTTASTTALVQTITAEAILALAPQSAGAALLRRSLNVDLGRAGAVVVPSVVARASDFAFVGQGAAIPVIQLAFEGPMLSLRKLASIAVFSREVVEHTASESIVRAVLGESLALAVDLAVLGDTAGDDNRPGGLRHAVAALAASAETGEAAIAEDIRTLLTAIAPVAGNTRPVLIASAKGAVPLRLYTMRGDAGFDVLASAAVEDGAVVAVAPSALAATIGAPRFDTSRAGALHMASPASLLVPEGGTVSAPARSMFQTDTIALKTTLGIDWSLRSSLGVAWISGANW
jgi:hypothetical protein